MSGHNKWSKIKRKKEALDGKKSKVFSKHAVMLANEVKKAGGDVNSSNVRAAVERAWHCGATTSQAPAHAAWWQHH